jgi:hypothetical protein
MRCHIVVASIVLALPVVAAISTATTASAWAQAATGAAFDDAEAQLRVRQAATAAGDATRDVDELRKALGVERNRVVQSGEERDLNQEMIRTLEDKLREAEAKQRDRDATLKQAQQARSQGLAAEAQRQKLDDAQRKPPETLPPSKNSALTPAPSPMDPRSQSLNSEFRNMSDRDVCKTALGEGRVRWDTRPNYTSYVEEAKQRGYSVSACNALTESPKEPAKPTSSFPTMDDRDICKTALGVGRAQWDTRPDFLSYVAEAKARGYSVSTCNALTANLQEPTIPRSNFPTMDDRNICSRALAVGGGQWDTRLGYSSYAEEAKRRGHSVSTCNALLRGG